MSVSVQSFKQTFEEFRSTDDAAVSAKLALAKLQINAAVWGAKTDLGVLYLTAHLVSLSPAGQNAKLKPTENAKTIYGEQYKQYKRQVTYGLRTAGAMPGGATNNPNNPNG